MSQGTEEEEVTSYANTRINELEALLREKHEELKAAHKARHDADDAYDALLKAISERADFLRKANRKKCAAELDMLARDLSRK